MSETGLRKRVAMMLNVCDTLRCAVCVALVLLCGCAVYHGREYTSPDDFTPTPLSDSLTIQVNMSPTASRFHLPCVLLLTRVGPAHSVELTIRSRTREIGAVRLTRVVISTPSGETYSLLPRGPEPVALNPVGRGDSSVARGTWQTQDLPMEYVAGGTYRLVINLTVGSKQYVVSRDFNAKEERYRESIFRAYQNI